MNRIIASFGLALLLAAIPASVGAQSRARGKTPTLLDMFPSDQMTCGRTGWTFRNSILGGHIPVTACMLKYRNNTGSSPFGPL